MDPDALRQAVEHAGFVAAGVGFLAGLAFSFNPVAMAAIPVSLAYMTKAREKQQPILFGASIRVSQPQAKMSSNAALNDTSLHFLAL